MTVYCIQEPRGTAEGMPKYDVLEALPYGEIEFLFSEFAQLVKSSGAAINLIRKKLQGFNDKDYLIAAGDPALIAMSCLVASDLNFGKVKLLKWDRKAGKYYPLSIDLYNKEKEDDE
tara:strand:- start:386 stop:736 length:351 start_codon:yes stop_codon:yes gene_type:complete